MKKRVILVGAGHAHLLAIRQARRFADAGHDLVVVAPEPFWYSGLATGMLGGFYPPALDRIDVQRLATGGGARFIEDRMVGLDRLRRQVVLAAGEPLAYDALSLNLGSTPPLIPGATGPGCYAVKPIARLVALRTELESRLASGGAPLRIVIAGAGPTGCELAGNIARLAGSSGGKARISILAAGDRILAQLSVRAAAGVKTSLERRGVRFRTGCRVVGVDDGRASLANGDAVAFDVFINAAGLSPAPHLRALDLPLDPEGALIVDRHLRSPADPRIHGGGDCVALQGQTLARAGVYAIRQAPVLMHNLLAGLDGTPPRIFSPQRRYLWIMNLGDGTGLASRGKFWWRGRAAFRLKDWIDRRFLRAYRMP